MTLLLKQLLIQPLRYKPCIENFDENYPQNLVEKDIENLRTLYMNIMYLELNLQIVEKFIM
jgi:hypothetical protein